MSNTEKIYDIRYARINFTVQFIENTIMPEHKSSALRGGIGEMLLCANCIRDRICEKCDFESECIVQRTMYSKFDKKPDYVTTGDSVGYVMECENYQTVFEAGDIMTFSIILFGKTIVYFTQYLQAIYDLGQKGIGKHKSRFQIVKITNHLKQDILSENNILMEKYKVSTIKDYISYRKHKIEEIGLEREVIFRTPLSLKYNGVFIKEFDMGAVLKNIARRLYTLDCFEGIEVSPFRVEEADIPRILNQLTQFSDVKRYSNRQKNTMPLRGIKGKVLLDEITDNALELLLAGELIHAGKNTSFGLGKIVLR